MSPCYHTALTLLDTTLDFSLGYWKLYAQPMRVQMVNKHFADLPPHPPSAAEMVPFTGKDPHSIWILSHPVNQRVATLECSRWMLRYVPVRYPRYYVELRGTFEQYLQRFSRKRRGELRRKMRRFEQAGASFFREYRSGDEMPEFYKYALTVSKQSFQDRLGNGLSNDPHFLARLIQLAKDDRIRGYILFYGEHPVAFASCQANGVWLTGDRCGYDSAMSQLSPGSVLFSCILQRLFAEQRFNRLDFGTGDADYKAHLATSSVPCADVYYFPRTSKTICLVAAHYITATFWSWTKRTLDMLYLNEKLKKLARNKWKLSESNR